MDTRIKITLILLTLGLVLTVLPGTGEYSFKVKPAQLEESLFGKETFISVDRVARSVVREDSTMQLIDLRSSEEYSSFNIPGSMNIPFDSFFKLKPETFLYNREIRYIFYANDDLDSGYAVAIARGLGYENCYVMKGGLNEWFRTVMNSSFTGTSISPRENALFETRTRAKRFFTEINSLPDSLKLKYAESRRQAERELDGGCE